MYSELLWCVALVLAELKLPSAPYDLEASLEATAGLDPAGIETYRPYLYCAARIDSDSQLESGRGGTTFRVNPRVMAYLKRQAQLDSALGLTVPLGTEAVLPTNFRFGSSSVPITVL